MTPVMPRATSKEKLSCKQAQGCQPPQGSQPSPGSSLLLQPSGLKTVTPIAKLKGLSEEVLLEWFLPEVPRACPKPRKGRQGTAFCAALA